MDTTQTVTHISLCAGYGGIDLGLRGAIPNLRTVAFSEIEGFACANLVSKMEAGLLDCAPIWTDLKTFPWRAFRDRVDILSGGYPCQPFSAAGKRLGTDDPRHLWPFIADGIRLLRPRICFFENVEGHISLGLREVIGELESMGYSVSWGIFSAREVGAPHQRKRVFIMAYDKISGLERLRKCSSTEGWSAQTRHSGGGSYLRTPKPTELANTVRNGSGEGWIPCKGSDGSKFVSNGESRRTSMADTSHSPDPTCRHAEADRLPSEHRSEICARESGGADADAWPSRPGQPQYGWEPPRVVANSASERANGGHQLCDEECGQGRALPLQSDDSGEDMGNAGMQKPCGLSDWTGWEDLAETGQPSKSLGNSEEQGCGRLDDESGETGGRETRGHVDWSSNPEQQEQWQAESTLGGDADGPTRGMDYAELCVTCDNRTDELRLLGNGVVPATATLAFQTLLTELLTL